MKCLCLFLGLCSFVCVYVFVVLLLDVLGCICYLSWILCRHRLNILSNKSGNIDSAHYFFSIHLIQFCTKHMTAKNTQPVWRKCMCSSRFRKLLNTLRDKLVWLHLSLWLVPFFFSCGCLLQYGRRRGLDWMTLPHTHIFFEGGQTYLECILASNI